MKRSRQFDAAALSREPSITGRRSSWWERILPSDWKIRPRRRIWLTRLEYAVMRMESAVTIALIIVALPTAWLLSGARLVPDGTWIVVLLIAMTAECALIACSMLDPKAGRSEVRAMLNAHYGVPEIEDDAIRDQVTTAIEYRVRTEEALGGASRPLHATMSETMDAVDRWIAGIARLATRLDRMSEDVRFQTGNKLPLRERINDLEKRAREATGRKIHQLRETIAGHKHQLRMIVEMEELLESGHLRLEHAVGALGTVYTQLTIVAARGMDGGEAAQLAAEISAETEQVDAVLSAMDRIWSPPPVMAPEGSEAGSAPGIPFGQPTADSMPTTQDFARGMGHSDLKKADGTESNRERRVDRAVSE